MYGHWEEAQINKLVIRENGFRRSGLFVRQWAKSLVELLKRVRNLVPAAKSHSTLVMLIELEI